jgi:hypothetical protein
MISRLYQTLTYKITITRENGEIWPPLAVGKSRYDVSKVEAEVAVFLPDSLFAAPVFDVRPVYAADGRRIEGDALGGIMIGRHIYHGRDGSPADRQAKKFESQALGEARGAYRTFIETETERSRNIAR